MVVINLDKIKSPLPLFCMDLAGYRKKFRSSIKTEPKSESFKDTKMDVYSRWVFIFVLM